MAPNLWLTLTACGVVLALALLGVIQGSPNSLALTLVVLTLDICVWNLAAYAYLSTGNLHWHWVDHSISPFCAPLALHFSLIFVGRRRELGRPLLGLYLGFALLASIPLLAFGSPAAAVWAEARAWYFTYLAGIGVTIAFAAFVLVGHLRQNLGPDERLRTWSLLLAFPITALLVSTELLADLGWPLPRLGNFAILCGSVLIGFSTLRFRLIERQLSSLTALAALGLAALGMLCYATLFRIWGADRALLVLGSIGVTIALFAALRRVIASFAARRQRSERMATLGQFAAQMAHDIRNPLSALKGAAQFLKQEWMQGKTGPSQLEFLDLIGAEVVRMERVIENYQRLGRVEPLLASLQVNPLVREIVALKPFAAVGVAVFTELAEDLPPCRIDSDLFSGALENLLRNAAEAMPGGGALTIRTSLVRTGRDFVAVEVADSGPGMDARTQEHAFDAFFSTKAAGSGLGLAFVRRVMEAHGGAVALTSDAGRGTRVRMTFPSL
jgi:two-component system, NtrC family, sensor histidine kinase HydH